MERDMKYSKVRWAISFFTLVLLSSASVKASWFVEPAVGYEFGVLRSKAIFNDTKSKSIRGESVGARLGYSFLGASFGAEYVTAQLKPEGKSKGGMKDLFVTVGYGLPGLGVFGGYSLKSQLGSHDLEGQAYKMGFRISSLPFIALNFQFLVRRFEKKGSESIVAVDNSSKTFLFTVSLPLP